MATDKRYIVLRSTKGFGVYEEFRYDSGQTKLGEKVDEAALLHLAETKRDDWNRKEP
jgi:hypothetical protein